MAVPIDFNNPAVGGFETLTRITQKIRKKWQKPEKAARGRGRKKKVQKGVQQTQFVHGIGMRRLRTKLRYSLRGTRSCVHNVASL